MAFSPVADRWIFGASIGAMWVYDKDVSTNGACDAELDLTFGTGAFAGSANAYYLDSLRCNFPHTEASYGYDLTHMGSVAEKILRRNKELIVTVCDRAPALDGAISATLANAIRSFLNPGSPGSVAVEDIRRTFVSMGIASGNAAAIEACLAVGRSLRALFPRGVGGQFLNGGELDAFPIFWNPFQPAFAQFARANGYAFPGWEAIRRNFANVSNLMYGIWGDPWFGPPILPEGDYGRHVYAAVGNHWANTIWVDSGNVNSSLIDECNVDSQTGGGFVDRGNDLSYFIFMLMRPNYPRSISYPFRRLHIHSLGRSDYISSWKTNGGTLPWFNLNGAKAYDSTQYQTWMTANSVTNTKASTWTLENLSAESEPNLRLTLIELARQMNGR